MSKKLKDKYKEWLDYVMENSRCIQQLRTKADFKGTFGLTDYMMKKDQKYQLQNSVDSIQNPGQVDHYFNKLEDTLFDKKKKDYYNVELESETEDDTGVKKLQANDNELIRLKQTMNQLQS